jgi:hypothetical protein
MSRSRIRPIATLAAVTALAIPSAAMAKTKAPPPPRGTTGSATHVLPTSALLTGSVVPNKFEISYYFVYGTEEKKLISQTPATLIGNGGANPTAKVRVGKALAGLIPGQQYFYAIVVTYPGAPKPTVGKEHKFRTKGNAPGFEVPKKVETVYGSPFILNGTLRGQGNASHSVVLQASPFPFLESFTPIGIPTLTNSQGRFAFRVSNLTSTTQLRLSTLDARPLYSRTVTVDVQVRVTLHARSAGGLVRLYGTVVPAVHGAKVIFQVQKAVRPGKSEATSRYVSQFQTVAKKAKGNADRFSMITHVRHAGRYRAYVQLKPGPLASGTSNSLVLRLKK